MTGNCVQQTLTFGQNLKRKLFCRTFWTYKVRNSKKTSVNDVGKPQSLVFVRKRRRAFHFRFRCTVSAPPVTIPDFLWNYYTAAVGVGVLLQGTVSVARVAVPAAVGLQLPCFISTVLWQLQRDRQGEWSLRHWLDDNNVHALCTEVDHNHNHKIEVQCPIYSEKPGR